MTAPENVIRLVENFERNREAYRSGRYNETQVRRDFIDPFFKELGWDMDNSAGYAEAYRDVIHEDAIKIGESTKAPDYCFRVGGQRKFFLEAKKPSVNIKTDVGPAFQLRRYAWSAKLSLSIVTDFEEFAIYDCRQKPSKDDKASVSRLFYCTYEEYSSKWDEISQIFGKDAILKGSFDKYANESKGKRGTSEVDAAFLGEIERWRDILARNIAIRNADLSQRELNFSVQQIIDRIIFLRICEDRGIEPYGRLKELAGGKEVYPRLTKIFRDADDRYNSGLFHFSKEKGRIGEPDELTPSLCVDDAPLKEIFGGLYYPDCPYEFSVLGADILGSVYEQFLGKVIRLTAGHRAVVEDKPEVKKAGGVFYTPTYIVDYIVKSTVGEKFNGKNSNSAGDVRVLDPACGSGSFLIGAYQFLIDWYLERYIEEGAEKFSKGKDARIRATSGGSWKLTTNEKKRILLAHIYGVDVDAQAVEVTKLSLLLKVLEDESGESLDSQMKLFHERVLPDLDRNIKCGNSLIAPNFYEDNLDLGGDDAQRINVFDWHSEFPEIFIRGGFDAVIGNPPYGAYLYDPEKNYLRKEYPCQNYQLDSYQLFLEKSLKSLTRDGGLYGMIIPNPWLTNLSQTEIRKYLFSNVCLLEIVHFNFPVFKKVVVDTQILIAKKEIPSKNSVRVKVVSSVGSFVSKSGSPEIAVIEHDQDKWASKGGDVVNIFTSPQEEALAAKLLQGSVLLGTLCAINVGIKPYQVGKGKPAQTRQVVDGRPFDSDVQLDPSFRKCLRGSDIQRYRILPVKPRYLKYGEWLAEPRPAIDFDAPEKIVMRQTGDSLVAALDSDRYLCMNNMHVLINKNETPTNLYLLGIINSKLMNWYYQTLNPEAGEALAEVKKTNVSILPIRISNDSVSSAVRRHMELCQQQALAKTPQESSVIQRQIDASEKQIDRLVYGLYALTENEIRLIETASSL